MPAAIGGSLTINFDAGVSSVTVFGTTITTSGNSIEDISADDGTSYTGTFVLNSGYAIDTIIYSDNASGTGGTLSNFTDNDFALIGGVSGIVGTLTITTKKNANSYNITTSKPKIVIHCEGKSMTDNLVITNEIYMGEFEEINKGFTLTLISTTEIYDSGFVNSYSLDGGNTWNVIDREQIVLENVTQVKFQTNSNYYLINIGTTQGGTEILDNFIMGEIDLEPLTADATWYLSTYVGGGYD